MLPTNKFYPMLLAMAGCIGIAAFFSMNASLRAVKLLNKMHAESEFIERATAAFKRSDLAEFPLSRATRVGVNKRLFNYAQTRFNSSLPEAFFPVGNWRVSWSGPVETRKEGTQEASFVVEYDFTGRLIHFEQSAPQLRKSRNLKEPTALREALRCLHDYGVDTTRVRLSSKIVNRDERLLRYDFTFEKPSPISDELLESYEIKLAGSNVVSYDAAVDVATEEVITPPAYRTADIASKVLGILVWILVVLFAFVRFFKKLRHDELEFRRGLQIGFIALLLTSGAVLSVEWGRWNEGLLGGGISGLLTGLALTLIYAVADSTMRDIWPQKLAQLDVMWHGFWRVKELGRSILDSLLLSGLTLFGMGLALWMVEQLAIGRIEFSQQSFELFQAGPAFFAGMVRTVVSASFVGLLLFSFWPAYSKGAVHNFSLAFAAHVFLINLAGLRLLYIQPTYVAFLLFLPLAILWAYASIKCDLTAILSALFIVGVARTLILLPNLHGGIVSLPALLMAFAIVAALATGCVLFVSRRSIHDFRHYIPAYVSRIAERERLQNEIEIARHVQMRFLPQSVPEFPGLDIACICQPAMEIGGDYYDFIPNGQRSLGIIIGDVSGKGVSAAFYMTMAKGIVKTLARNTNQPRQILSEMNSIFYENVPQNVFISVMYGEFDLERRVLKFARAGHNPLVVYRKNGGKLESLLPDGLAIGLDSGTLFRETIEEMEVPFAPGDIFVFFTDGIPEATDADGAEFGEARLRELVAVHNHHPTQRLIETIRDEVHQFAGTDRQHDDLTMVVVKIDEDA